MKKQLGGPNKYGDRRIIRRFAFFPKQVMRKSDNTPFRIWWEWYSAEQKFYESQADWSDCYFYIEEQINK